MSTAAPAHCPVLWRDTPAGRAEAWVREKVEQRYDFQGAIEHLGVKRAAQVMREEVRE